MYKKTFLVAALGLLAALYALPASAAGSQQAIGYYGELWTYGAFTEDSDLEDIQTPGGVTVPAHIDFDDSFGFDAALGYDYGPVRLEGSFGYTNLDLNKMFEAGATYTGSGSFSVMSFLASGYYDFKTNSRAKPFIGAGAGLAKMHLDVPASNAQFTADDEAIVLAYHFTTGIGYQINPQLSFLMAYRYFGTTAGEFGGYSYTQARNENMKLKYGAHQFRVGMRIGF